MRVAAVWALAATLLAVATPARSQPAPTPVVSVAIADFRVVGLGEPRHWLGPVYAETLAQRIAAVTDLLVVEPIEARLVPPQIAPRDLATLTEVCLQTAKRLRVPFVISGLIEDKRDKLNVTALVVWAETGRSWALSQEATFDKPYLPQMDLVVRRFLPNMGVRLTPPAVEAMAAYEPALTLQTMELLGQGWRAYAPDEPEDSFKLWRRALVLDPNCRLAAQALASTGYRYRRQLLDRSLSFYEKELAADPKNPLAHLHLADVYADLGRWREAQQAYTRAMFLRNTLLPAYIGLSQALVAQGLYEQAVIASDGALRLSPNNTKALHNKAVALYRRGNAADARLLWLRILEIDPGNELAKQCLEQYARPAGPDLPR